MISQRGRERELRDQRNSLQKLFLKLESIFRNNEDTQKELHTFATHLCHGIDLFEDKEGIIGGWQGKPKGLLQVLWERGLISEVSLEKYTLEGRKDAITGQTDSQLSLRHLMAECTDF